jgi:glycosyltransferase involved in cell wall biosynthesis
MKVAIVHEWLTTVGGSERVLEQLVSLYPQADVFCLVDFLAAKDRALVGHKTVRTSFIQKLPFAKKHFRQYLPLFPLAIEHLDVSGYDLVLSSSHAVAKGVLVSPSQMHVCYCHTPMRYAWDLYHLYLREARLDRGLKGIVAKAFLHYIRLWDVSTANRVDHFVANSSYIAARIKKIYSRDARVIYPPVDVEQFSLGKTKEDFYFTASRMVPYKKIDLIVEAFSAMPDKRLVVIGDGPAFGRVKAKAANNITLLGHQPSDVLKGYLQKARAFIFAAEEDFGILPVEAQACGTPVIAYGKGGVRETTIDMKTGIFYEEQTIGSLQDAVRNFEAVEGKFDSLAIRRNAERFSIETFRNEFKNFIDDLLAKRSAK